ncbi:hypothetical protein BJ546DRAFT_679846 [Cryomyces antarcticus]
MRGLLRNILGRFRFAVWSRLCPVFLGWSKAVAACHLNAPVVSYLVVERLDRPRASLRFTWLSIKLWSIRD